MGSHITRQTNVSPTDLHSLKLHLSLPNQRVTLAGGLLETLPVSDPDPSAPVAVVPATYTIIDDLQNLVRRLVFRGREPKSRRPAEVAMSGAPGA